MLVLYNYQYALGIFFHKYFESNQQPFGSESSSPDLDHLYSAGEENILNCSNGSSGSCSYVPEHIWNVTCADSYSESFEGNEALCLASCSEDSRCNFFWAARPWFRRKT